MADPVARLSQRDRCYDERRGLAKLFRGCDGNTAAFSTDLAATVLGCTLGGRVKIRDTAPHYCRKTHVLRLVRPDSPELWAVARSLVEDYAASLDLDLGFQDFGHEVESLATDYGPPDGCFLLAKRETSFVGCGAFRKFADSVCEMKRLYVVPTSRGEGVGLSLAKALIEEARHLGYKRMLLDTLPSMTRAHALYTSLGFRPTPAYRYNPVPGTSFLELELRANKSLSCPPPEPVNELKKVTMHKVSCSGKQPRVAQRVAGVDPRNADHMDRPAGV